jgi:hypothetical protein
MSFALKGAKGVAESLADGHGDPLHHAEGVASRPGLGIPSRICYTFKIKNFNGLHTPIFYL